MKKIILATIALLPALAFAQGSKFTVDGALGSYNAPAKVYIQYRLSKTLVKSDSATLVNGKFHFTGSIPGDPVNAVLAFNGKGTGMNYTDYKSIYLESGTITVTGADSLHKAQVGGTKINDDNTRFEASLKPVYDAYTALEAKQNTYTADQKNDKDLAKADNKAEKAIEAQESALNKKFIQDNPDSYLSLNVLESYAYSADYVDIAPLFNGLTPAVKGTESGKKFAERLPLLKAVALGAVAPVFAEADTSGKIVNLTAFRGKYVLIDFWASWCGPCRHENPNVVKAFNKYKTQKFTIIGVSLDRPGAKDKWLAAIHKDGLAWTQVSDLKFWDSKTAALYAVRGIPQNFLLDPDGKIIGKNLRGDDLDDKLAEIFGKIGS
jgi:peroxiredoxin